jgi:hypothetical protein
VTLSGGPVRAAERLLSGVRRRMLPGRYARNLLILHTAGNEDPSDWTAVKTRIESDAPDIEVRLDSNDRPSGDIYRWQASRPSLVFSPFRLIGYRPSCGKVYAGREIGKVAEWQRMVDSGLPVPRTCRLLPGLRLEPEDWGDYIIVKPIKGMRGRGIRLIRTEEVGQRYAELSGGGRERMLVQEHIDSVDSQGRPFTYRVLTAFGEPLCMAERGLADPRKPLAEIAADPAGRIATNAEGVSKRANLVVVPDVLALACRVASAFPEIPCLGQDIIRDRATGGLYVLETNPGGAVWHLSSDFARPPGYDRAYAARRYAQFNALDVVARQLIARTRAEAS